MDLARLLDQFEPAQIVIRNGQELDLGASGFVQSQERGCNHAGFKRERKDQQSSQRFFVCELQELHLSINFCIRDKTEGKSSIRGLRLVQPFQIDRTFHQEQKLTVLRSDLSSISYRCASCGATPDCNPLAARLY